VVIWIRLVDVAVQFMFKEFAFTLLLVEQNLFTNTGLNHI